MIIVGRDDSYRAGMEWMATELPNAALAVMDGVGHFPFIEAADLFGDRVTAFVTA